MGICGDGGNGWADCLGSYFDRFTVDIFRKIPGFMPDLLRFGIVVGRVFVPEFFPFDTFDPDDGFYALNK